MVCVLSSIYKMLRSREKTPRVHYLLTLNDELYTHEASRHAIKSSPYFFLLRVRHGNENCFQTLIINVILKVILRVSEPYYKLLNAQYDTGFRESLALHAVIHSVFQHLQSYKNCEPYKYLKLPWNCYHSDAEYGFVTYACILFHLYLLVLQFVC
jgi:hypothetical protein